MSIRNREKGFETAKQNGPLAFADEPTDRVDVKTQSLGHFLNRQAIWHWSIFYQLGSFSIILSCHHGDVIDDVYLPLNGFFQRPGAFLAV